ncbi:MAG: Acetaldehyde dehydrogenase [Alphaproteobacteria bacterium]|nr:Acetaldehyde dehydrogenase [Alphaproteobacteria bacterium]
MSKIKCAIVGSGNIGTDLMIKILKGSDSLELAAVVGIDEKSEGLAMARERGVATTHEGIQGLKKMAS